MKTIDAEGDAEAAASIDAADDDAVDAQSAPTYLGLNTTAVRLTTSALSSEESDGSAAAGAGGTESGGISQRQTVELMAASSNFSPAASGMGTTPGAYSVRPGRRSQRRSLDMVRMDDFDDNTHSPTSSARRVQSDSVPVSSSTPLQAWTYSSVMNDSRHESEHSRRSEQAAVLARLESIAVEPTETVLLDDSDVPNAIELGDYPSGNGIEKHAFQGCYKRRTILHTVAAVAALLTVSAVVVAVIVAVEKQDSSPSGEEQLQMSDRYLAIKAILESAANVTIHDDPASLSSLSPQHRALYWLADVDGRALPLSDETAIVQRYAVATIYFATGGDQDGGKNTWTNNLDFLSERHECVWNNVVEEYFYDPKWLLESIDLLEESQHDSFLKKGILCSNDGRNQVVEKIWLAENNLTGSLPDELALLTNVSDLFFSSNQLEGQLPSAMRRLINVEKLSFSYINDLTGTIPSWIHDMRSIREIRFDSTPLGGTLPSFLTSLPDLEVLELGPGCNIHGAIPAFGDNDDGIAVQSKLRYLSMDFCPLSGTIPPSIFDLPSLTELHLASSSLTGSLPSNIGNASMLKTLFLGHIDVLDSTFGNALNQFTGTIPPSLFDLSELVYFNVVNNRLNGTLSHDFGRLKNLRSLYLSNNDFSGTVPDSFSNLTSLEIFALPGNQLSGEMDFLCAMSVEWTFGNCLPNNNDFFVSCPCCAFCCSQEMYEAGEGYYGCFPNEDRL